MISVLCVDDSSEACAFCKRVIEDAAAPATVEFVESASVVGAKRLISQRQFDVALLDILLPMRDGEPPKLDGGIQVLDYILTSSRARRPRYVIGMSAEASVLASVSQNFLQSMFTIFERRISDLGTTEPLAKFISYLVSQQTAPSDRLDSAGLAPLPLAVVCAAAEEFRAIKRVFTLPDTSLELADDPTGYFVGTIRSVSGEHKVVVAQAAEQGMPVTAALVSKIVCRFRPRYVAMSGIAASVSDDLHFGDIIFADQTWDYTTGKAVVESGTESSVKPENRSLRADPTVIEQMRRLASDHQFLATVRAEWPAAAPETQLSLQAGPIASGGSVVEDPRVREAVLDRDRKTLGLDMEAHAVAAACWYGVTPKPAFVVAKSVVDYAVPPKTNVWQPYGSYTSARIIFEWARRFL